MDSRELKRLFVVMLVLVMVVIAGSSATLDAQETHGEPAGEDHDATEEHGEQHGEHHGEHFHKNHLAVFVGSTEAEEHHGEKGDPDFTLGVDYERRLSPLFGVGGMFDWVVEGRREWLIGPIGFLHPYKGLKFFAAPCYQHIREGEEDNFVVRLGAAWDFEIGKYSIAPNVIYEFAGEHDFLVLGLTIGRGF
jgi:hypothetical protein